MLRTVSLSLLVLPRIPDTLEETRELCQRKRGRHVLRIRIHKRDAPIDAGRPRR